MKRHVLLFVNALFLSATLASCAQVGGVPAPGMLGRNLPGVLGAAGLDAQGVVLVGAGDIAYKSPGAAATAKLLDGVAGTVFTLGDNAYQSGSAEEYAKYYHPTWGRHKDRTRPVVGNHEYRTPGAAGYFDYFGAAAGDRTRGYYAYDAGPHWRVVVLNSNAEAVGGLGPDSAQYRWLESELDAQRDKNVVAMWHHPLHSTGFHGDTDQMQAMWRLMYMRGVDVALTGHDHHYERFFPMDGRSQRDDVNGIRAFVVGTGGKNHYPFFKLPKRTTAVRNANTFGVLKLTLHPGSYEWEFLPEAGKRFTDVGRAAVH